MEKVLDKVEPTIKGLSKSYFKKRKQRWAQTSNEKNSATILYIIQANLYMTSF